MNAITVLFLDLRMSSVGNTNKQPERGELIEDSITSHHFRILVQYHKASMCAVEECTVLTLPSSQMYPFSCFLLNFALNE